MADTVFGLDFGTTNSLAAVAIGDSIESLTEERYDRPHPSVVWYRGSDIIVGRQARDRLETSESSFADGFIRSPKMTLRREGAVHVLGQRIDPVDVVAEVLKHIRRQAAERTSGTYSISRAVMTVPVDFAGAQRRDLRAAAAKASIDVVQFVHEPAAALYAYLRSSEDFIRTLGQFENQVVLVFDWGGGTLDLTLCRVLGGKIFQIRNFGENNIGGDEFDKRIRNEIRDRYAKQADISNVSAVEQPGVKSKLLTQCELAKIALSETENSLVLIKDYARVEGPARHLEVSISRSDIEALSRDLIDAGLGAIDRVLDEAQLDRRDVELCLATGGMVNMPAIWNGLVERFGARAPKLPNRDRIIAEGAAWIARDDLRPTLAKPIELEIADEDGHTTFLPLVDSGQGLPVENQVISASRKQLYCVDPRDGVAVFKFVKPKKVGLLQTSDSRTCLGVLNLPVDPNAPPFVERLECEITLDADYIAHVRLNSKGRNDAVESEFHNLEFGLSLPTQEADETDDDPDDFKDQSKQDTKKNQTASKITLRPNIVNEENWKLVPGDIVETWKPNWLNKTQKNATQFQLDEKMYYVPCARCNRTSYQIETEGWIPYCSTSGCGLESGANRQ